MLITTIEELRLSAPAHALYTIDGLVGFIDNSEHEFLADKLGQPLYDALCRWYDDNPVTRTTVEDYNTGYYNRLLLMCQRIVAFDALGRAAGMQTVSVNNAGINQSTADDYPVANKDNIDLYRQTCAKEAHAALNRLLQTLEEWTKAAAAVVDGSAAVPAASPSGSVVDGSAIDEELAAITALWRSSRYFYLSTASLIPTATCLQRYVNIYDSREKFIQLLPDLLFIQEEVIAPSIGEDFLAWLILRSLQGDSIAAPAAVHAGSAPGGSAAGMSVPVPAAPAASGSAEANSSFFILHSSFIQNLIHRLRKVIAALLVERTQVLKFTKEQRQQAHDDSVRLMQTAINFIRRSQPAILAATAPAASPAGTVPSGSAAGVSSAAAASGESPFLSSPLYTPPAPESAVSCASPQEPQPHHCGCNARPHFKNNRPGSALFLTPFLN